MVKIDLPYKVKATKGEPLYPELILSRTIRISQERELHRLKLTAQKQSHQESIRENGTAKPTSKPLSRNQIGFSAQEGLPSHSLVF